MVGNFCNRIYIKVICTLASTLTIGNEPVERDDGHDASQFGGEGDILNQSSASQSTWLLYMRNSVDHNIGW
jgi:hypothetical protein